MNQKLAWGIIAVLVVMAISAWWILKAMLSSAIIPLIIVVCFIWYFWMMKK